MKKRIILHIGFPKTGTTTIQNFMYERRDILLKQRKILYPSLAPNLTDALCTMFLKDPGKLITNKMKGLTEKADLDKLAKKYQRTLERELSSTEYNTIFLSAEGVSNVDAEGISRLKKWGNKYADSWTVIVYVRHPVSYTRSVIQQIMKGGETLENLYEKIPLPRYKGKLIKFINVFGKENINVFEFESAVRTNLLHSFCRQMDLSDLVISDRQDFLDKRENESMSMEAVLVLNRINHIRPVFINGKRNELRSNQELAQVQRIKGNKFFLPQKVEEAIKKEARDDIKWLNEEFNLNLYNDIFTPVDDESLSSMRENCVISDEAIDSIASIILELIDTKGYSTARKFYNVFKERFM